MSRTVLHNFHRPENQFCYVPSGDDDGHCLKLDINGNRFSEMHVICIYSELPICKMSAESVESVDIVHGIIGKSGQYPWILWTKSREPNQTE